MNELSDLDKKQLQRAGTFVLMALSDALYYLNNCRDLDANEKEVLEASNEILHDRGVKSGR